MDLTPSRRDFNKLVGGLTAVSALSTMGVPLVHAAENNTLQVALIGCGGRGTGAAFNALNTKGLGPIKLVAMADVFEDRLKSCHQHVSKRYPDQVDVPPERRFIGFDAYQKAIDCLKPGDVAIFATPPGFRWVHFGYAISKGIHVFMEKPISVDGPSTRRMFKLGEEATKKNLKVGVGLMCRHCKARGELSERIKNGELGDLIALRCYRLQPDAARAFAQPNPGQLSDLMYQVQWFHSFLWASGGCFSDFYIHHIDECSWMKGSFPVQAHALGGRHFRNGAIDQNFDAYDVEYTYADGSKLFMQGRTMQGCHNEFASYAHGTKGLAIISQHGHYPAKSRMYKGQNMVKENIVWNYGGPDPNPYDVEWLDLVAAIRNDQPYNEIKRGADASLVTAMGRMAAHTGQIITYDQMLNCEHDFAPELDKLTMDSQPPLKKGPDGKYPVPEPGVKKTREF